MRTIPISQVRSNIFQLVDETAESHDPVLVTSKRNNAVLVSEADWNSLQETLYLLSVPGMRKKILDASATPLEECYDEDQLLW